jgi:hypothetical protein
LVVISILSNVTVPLLEIANPSPLDVKLIIPFFNVLSAAGITELDNVTVCPLKSIVDFAGTFKEFKVKSSNNVILSPG